ncbi:hypothetical protein KKF82_05370, partial [Patescibacteria group bacterium]|nr:hypothetical protein [Patescibacteria group bacterium]
PNKIDVDYINSITFIVVPVELRINCAKDRSSESIEDIARFVINNNINGYSVWKEPLIKDLSKTDIDAVLLELKKYDSIMGIKIIAIKFYRKMTDSFLKEAKEYVDSLWSQV